MIKANTVAILSALPLFVMLQSPLAVAEETSASAGDWPAYVQPLLPLGERMAVQFDNGPLRVAR